MISRIRLAPQGPEFSRLIHGTWRILDDPSATSQDINRRLNECVALGMTTLDTAEIYGLYDVEAALGKAFALSPGLRDKMQIVTKAGIYVPCHYHPDRKTAFYNATSARLVKSLEKSLRFLGTDHVELMLVHRPDWLTPASDTAAGLNQLVRDGKIHHAGVSNYNVHQYQLLNGYMEKPLVTNQVEFHLLHMDPIYDGVFDQLQGQQVIPMAWSPLAKGRLFDPADEAAERIRQTAKALAPKYNNASLEQLAYAWIMAHPSKPTVITGTNKIERLQAAAQSEEIQLEREDWYALWEAAQGRRIP